MFPRRWNRWNPRGLWVKNRKSLQLSLKFIFENHRTIKMSKLRCSALWPGYSSIAGTHVECGLFWNPKVVFQDFLFAQCSNCTTIQLSIFRAHRFMFRVARVKVTYIAWKLYSKVRKTMNYEKFAPIVGSQETRLALDRFRADRASFQPFTGLWLYNILGYLQRSTVVQFSEEWPADLVGKVCSTGPSVTPIIAHNATLYTQCCIFLEFWSFQAR